VEAGRGRSSVSQALDEAPLSRYHFRAVVASGAGFFTDAYDLFVISTVATLAAAQWHLSTTQKSWVTGAAILGAFVGATVFGRVADLFGRRTVYGIVAVIMICGALLSAFSNGFVMLVVARLVLGIGIGGDYPVSAVLMSEYSNRSDRGRTVGLVFSMQALGLIVGPLVALGLLSSGVSHELTWRLLLGLGAIPAAAVLHLRSKMPESPRYEEQARGNTAKAAADLHRFSNGIAVVNGTASGAIAQAPEREARRSARAARSARSGRLIDLLKNPTMLRLLLGTAGSWLLFDYAYYGNTLSLPTILKEVSPTASISQQLLWSLAIFVVCAVPGYILAFTYMDRIGHRRLQLIGFTVMAAAFVVLGLVPALTAHVAPFLAIFGLSYLFIEFGPNSTTFVLPSEVFPLKARTTGHGIAAGIGKLGAFVGVFLVPSLEKSIGLRGMLIVAAAASVAGFAVTLLLPEPARRSLDDVSEPKILPLDVGQRAPGEDESEPALVASQG
jgi:PHS family inorganic phosphate transporter-like MFS transporter